MHATEVGSDAAARVASASCECGWAKVFGFARSAGEPVALRLAQLHAARHASETDGNANHWAGIPLDRMADELDTVATQTDSKEQR